jgi:hypothetical protein
MVWNIVRRIFPSKPADPFTVTVTDQTAALLQRGIAEGKPVKYLNGSENAERVKRFLLK